MVKMAEKHRDKTKELSDRLVYRQGTVEEMDGGEWDLVCCSEVVEHVDKQREFLANCIKRVKPGSGYFFQSSMARTPESWLLYILAGEYLTGMIPRGSLEWRLFLNAEEAEQIPKENGVRVIKKTGAFVGNPITMEMNEVDGWLRGNYIIIGKKDL